MNIKDIENYLKNKPLTSKQVKSKKGTYYKVNGKTFAILSESNLPFITLKNKPSFNQLLRQEFKFVFPTCDIFNKQYWNTIAIVDELDFEALKKMIDQSYNMVFENMTKKQKLFFYNNVFEH